MALALTNIENLLIWEQSYMKGKPLSRLVFPKTSCGARVSYPVRSHFSTTGEGSELERKSKIYSVQLNQGRQQTPLSPVVAAWK
ncbi:hypothetical protein BVC80_1227g16 [Macleaya cordata]|uniref:Uncharacterized protein n=1 Tax=Macleaya cordata TaxID=56857 RepID=A0A200R8C2_MACCD|nr:hypothetical protein BVC80_1227g16 [Macleaya cordata]